MFERLFDNFCGAIGEVDLLRADDDGAMQKAAEKDYRIKSHGLCGWHIIKNLKKSVAPNLSQDNKDAMLSDFIDAMRAGEEAIFETSWGKLIEKRAPRREAAAGATRGALTGRIANLCRRHKWAACYFADNSIITLGIKAAQRVESVSAKIKSRMQRMLSLSGARAPARH